MVRSWLNGDFRLWSFSPDEKAAIVPAELMDNGKHLPNVKPNGDTSPQQDSVFLLTETEAMDYIKRRDERIVKNSQRICSMLRSSEESPAPWWLCTPARSAAVIAINGIVSKVSPNVADISVRPALWVDLKKLHL